MALDRLLDLFAYWFFFVLFFCFSNSYVRQTKLARSLINFWGHNKILIDWLIGYIGMSFMAFSLISQEPEAEARETARNA